MSFIAFADFILKISKNKYGLNVADLINIKVLIILKVLLIEKESLNLT